MYTQSKHAFTVWELIIVEKNDCRSYWRSSIVNQYLVLWEVILTLIKTVRKAFFRTLVISVETLLRRKKLTFTSEYKNDSWGYIANKHSGGSIDTNYQQEP